ncbi:acyltransferase [Lelliottia sp. WAP21]|uniref:acyltransferase family protein n=1 Tax=Lelliottia sp. WAP21 TaxID=2877426 RepID=UPI001E5A22A6|nr:acyltransferase [Lelliottia sp. WAP21]
MKLSQNQSDALESLRGLSAIAVLICHFFQVFLARFYPEYFYTDLIIAQSSVMIFFVMSGFLIGVSVQSNISRNGSFDLTSYAKSRFLRIYPPLLFAVILCFILSNLAPFFFESGSASFMIPDAFTRGKSLEMPAKEVLAALTLMNGFLPVGVQFNSPLWSLPYEVWYYVVFGLLATLRPGLVVLGLLFFCVISMANDRFMAYSVIWGAGFAMSFIMSKNAYAKFFCSVGLAYFAYLSYLNAGTFLSGTTDLEMYKITFGLAFAFLIYLALFVYDLPFNVLKKSSKISYTLYITHFPVMLFFIGTFEFKVKHDATASAVVGVCAMAAALIISHYASRVFENKKIMTAMFMKKAPPVTLDVKSPEHTSLIQK